MGGRSVRGVDFGISEVLLSVQGLFSNAC
ncbi:hypothetical protein LINPERPRIM_LOCUS31858 [Linum perenne]